MKPIDQRDGEVNTEHIRRTIADLHLKTMPEMPKSFIARRETMPGDELMVKTAYQQSVSDGFDKGSQKMDVLAEQNHVINENVGVAFEAVKIVAYDAAAARIRADSSYARADAAHARAETVDRRIDDLEAAPGKFAGKIVAKAGTLILIGILVALGAAVLQKYTGIVIPTKP